MIREILIAALVGLVVNEVTDISPWIAIRLARWAATHMYPDNAERAAQRREEWEALIEKSIPTKISKLIFGLGLGCTGLYCVGSPHARRVLAAVVEWIFDILPDWEDVLGWIANAVGLVLFAVYMSLPDLWQLIVLGGLVALVGLGAGLAWVITIPRATRKYRQMIFGSDEAEASAAPAVRES